MTDGTMPSTRTADRALALLAAVCETGPVSQAELARAAELSPATALRILRSLEATHFIERDGDGLYRPGGRMLRIGALALQRSSIVAAATPALEAIAEATGESAYLGMRHGPSEAMYIAMAEGWHSIRHAGWVGHTVPIAGTAVGAALAGELNGRAWAFVRDGAEPGVTGVSAPVRVGEPHGDAIAALSVIGPSFRLDPDSIQRIGELLAREADRLGLAAGDEPAAARVAR